MNITLRLSLHCGGIGGAKLLNRPWQTASISLLIISRLILVSSCVIILLLQRCLWQAAYLIWVTQVCQFCIVIRCWS